MRQLLSVVAGVALLAGCGSDRPEPAPDATQVMQNQPTDVDGHKVIAFNMDEDSGIVDVDGQDGRTEVAVGDSVTIGDDDYEVVQIVPSSGDQPDGWISLRRK